MVPGKGLGDSWCLQEFFSFKDLSQSGHDCKKMKQSVLTDALTNTELNLKVIFVHESFLARLCVRSKLSLRETCESA